MKPTKQIATILLALVMTMYLLAACGGESGSNTGNTGNTSSANTPLAQDSTTESDDLAAIETAMAIEAAQTTGVTGTDNGGGPNLNLGNIDPCSLLTVEEIEAALGPVQHKPGKAAEVAYYGAIGCVYADKSKDQTIELSVYPRDATLAPQAVMRVGAKPTSGLGDEAYEHSHEFLGDAVWVVLKNRALIKITVPLGKLEQGKTLMPRAIERLIERLNK